MLSPEPVKPDGAPIAEKPRGDGRTIAAKKKGPPSGPF
jgi:hypothetical protein